jgi:hypothetical protein
MSQSIWAVSTQPKLANSAMLLMFRFRNFRKCHVDPSLIDRQIEPRLAQVFVPLLSVIEDPNARQSLRELMRDYHRELVADRGMDMEAQVLQIIRDLQGSPSSQVRAFLSNKSPPVSRNSTAKTTSGR